MTAVLSFESTRYGFGGMNGSGTEMLRKTVQRQNSSSSIASNASSTSTLSANSTQSSSNGNGAVQAPADSSTASSWAARKKPTRGLWPPGKAEPATGISTARPQAVSSATSGATASSAISALHAPLLPSQQMANGNSQTAGSGVLREQVPSMPTAILHLLPMNGTFERKTITVPYAPDVLRIGRQTNQKTIPTPLNGYFDSKVLSRQHAEIYADRSGRIFIRDVKSSNGTFVNGMRLSQENKESEPRELREQDVLELGIDIVSEDQKTVVHHKVAAKVEHAGIYGQGGDGISFGDLLDPSAGGGLMASPHQMQLKRNNSNGSMNSRSSMNPASTQAAALGMGQLGQPQHMRNWLNPITTEHIVRKLNHEMKLAMQQSQEIARARHAIENMLGGKIDAPPAPEKRPSFEKAKHSPVRSKLDLKAHFSEPPAPPPQAPLPEKPDVAKALADPLILPLLRRNDTARPQSGSASPTRMDHSGDIIRLCEELKLAKGELSNQSERMRKLETELALERTARESAEERAQRLEEDGPRQDSPLTHHEEREVDEESSSATETTEKNSPDLQGQLETLRTSMDEMKQHMEAYRKRAEIAETERDEARKTLAQMVAEKRKANAENATLDHATKAPQTPPGKELRHVDGSAQDVQNRESAPSSPTSESLLERAGVEDGRPITPEQARMLTRFLAQEVLGSKLPQTGESSDTLLYYGVPYTSLAAVILAGWFAMHWINGWPAKVDR